jgi:hypothetical protein
MASFWKYGGARLTARGLNQEPIGAIGAIGAVRASHAEYRLGRPIGTFGAFGTPRRGTASRAFGARARERRSTILLRMTQQRVARALAADLAIARMISFGALMHEPPRGWTAITQYNILDDNVMYFYYWDVARNHAAVWTSRATSWPTSRMATARS